MRLLIDEHFPPTIAEQLRSRGHDVLAVAEERGLRGLSDAELFSEAQRRQRAIVTENVPDYLALDADYRSRQVPHWGLVLTSNRSFPRGRSPTVGALVKALDEWLASMHEEAPTSLVHWLQRST